MKPNEYNELPLGEQAIILWDKGKFIQLWEGNPAFKIGIYLLFEKVTVVYYDRNTNTITKIKMLSSSVYKEEILENMVLN